MITIKEISKILNLSTATISNVINGKTNQVSEKTLERVQEVLDKYEYIPNMNARNLVSKTSKLIGVGIVNYRGTDNYLQDAFISEMVGSIEAELRKYGYFMLLYFTPDPLELVKTVISWNVDGLILFGVEEKDIKDISNKFFKPKVFIDSHFTNEVKNSVMINIEDEEGGYLAGKYLLENGHKKIAYIADNLKLINKIRLEGFKKALLENNIEFTNSDIYILDSREAYMKEGLKKIFNIRNKYTAFFCASDFNALAISDYFSSRGLNIPKDLSLVGYDDSIYAKFSKPALSSIKQSPTKKGKIAVSNVLGKTSKKNKKIILPVELIKRDSVANISNIKRVKD